MVCSGAACTEGVAEGVVLVEADGAEDSAVTASLVGCGTGGTSSNSTQEDSAGDRVSTSGSGDREICGEIEEANSGTVENEGGEILSGEGVGVIESGSEILVSGIVSGGRADFA
jgi:hypothetical protein